MAIGNPVSYWYGTKAQYNALSLHLADTLYFITDEQTIYKGDVRFAEGVEQLSAVDSSAPSSPDKYDKYFNTDDGKIYVYDGTSWGNAYYPAEGNMYYDKNAKRFVYFVPTYDGTTVTGGSMSDVYDAGVSGDANQGVSIQGTSTVTVANASVNSKGVVKIGDNINVTDAGVISVPTANSLTAGVVKTGDNITNTNGVISVVKATTSALGVVKVGTNINVDNNGQISVPVANNDTKGVVSSGENVNNNNGVLSVNTGSTDAKGVVKVGTNIDVADGVISVKDASTSDKGVVKLTNTDSDLDSETTAITPKLVNTLVEDVIAAKQDNLSAVEPVVLNASTVSLNYDAPIYKNGSNLALDIGDGLVVGVAGSTNANKLIVNEASVKEVLEDVVDGGTEPAVNEIVTADNLKGALSVGQAVDVSCNAESAGNYNATLIKYSNSDTYIPASQANINTGDSCFIDGFSVKGTNAVTGFTLGWISNVPFPKRAPGLVYLFIADVRNRGTTNVLVDILGGTAVSGLGAKTISPEDDAGEYTRFASTFGEAGVASLRWQVSTNVETMLDIINWRVYEVTALTDEAIAYIAKLPDPDAFFRSTSAYSIRDKYLIKQDMVCPFIPTINMPDNSDLTVAAGLSYKIKYTNDNTHTITADTIPSDAYGWDTHIQMFIKGTSAINFQAPLVLMDALTPNAGHNMVVKWRNGDALVYVDDTNAGYIVVKASGTGTGTLNDAISNDYTDYAIFSGDLDGTVIDAGDATFAGGTGFTAVNILGNGTEDTVITGNISATSGKTINFQSLTIDGGTFGGDGTINLDDVVFVGSSDVTNMCVFNTVFIPSGSTVTNIGTSRMSVKETELEGTIVGSIFVRNRLYGTGGGVCDGGGTTTPIDISNTGNDVVIQNIRITGGSNANSGGGMTINSCRTCFIENCSFDNNQAQYNSKSIWVNIFGDVIIKGTTFSDPYPIMINHIVGSLTIDNCAFNYPNGTYFINSTITGGYSNTPYKSKVIFKNTITLYGNIIPNPTVINYDLYLDDNCILDCTHDYYNVTIPLINYNGMNTKSTGEYIYIGDNVSIITKTGITTSIDGCRVDAVYSNGKLVNTRDGIITITSELPIWKATNIIFASPLDATEADTIKLSGTTFTTTAKTLNTNRIQLPASTTVSFQGNTNDANTKILDAGLIVVGDNPASPSGSATIVNASGASSTVTGIGTYIDKEGDNDFVANNATNVVPVDASTTGAKYLGTVLSATTGDTGANRFAKIDSGAVAVVNESTNAVNKQIITHDYEPILGGTFSLTSATVDEATKTTTILEGGTMSIVDIRGGKDSVIDLGYNAETQTGGTNIQPVQNVVASGCTFTGGVGVKEGQAADSLYGGAFEIKRAGVSCTFRDCDFTGNTAKYGAALVTYYGSNHVIELNGCNVFDNPGNYAVFLLGQNDTIKLSNSLIGGNQVIRLTSASDKAEVYGSNSLGASITGAGTVTLTSGAILDLTGNTNSVPINPGGGITFESGGATVKVGDSTASSSYMMDNVTLPAGAKLTNTALVDLGGTTTANCYGVSGATIESGWLRINSGATAIGNKLISNGRFNVYGITSSNTVKSGGLLYVYSGGVANNDTIEFNGRVNVNSGSVVNNAIAKDAQAQIYVYAGGVASNTTVSSGGQHIISGGTSVEPVISSGGTLTVSSSGTALLVTSQTGAIITVQEGGYITYK